MCLRIFSVSWDFEQFVCSLAECNQRTQQYHLIVIFSKCLYIQWLTALNAYLVVTAFSIENFKNQSVKRPNIQSYRWTLENWPSERNSLAVWKMKNFIHRLIFAISTLLFTVCSAVSVSWNFSPYCLCSCCFYSLRFSRDA